MISTPRNGRLRSWTILDQPVDRQAMPLGFERHFDRTISAIDLAATGNLQCACGLPRQRLLRIVAAPPLRVIAASWAVPGARPRCACRRPHTGTREPCGHGAYREVNGSGETALYSAGNAAADDR